jgi:hypothetical protein
MGRKKRGNGPHEKISVLLPQDLYQQVEQLRERRGVDLSVVVRELMAKGLRAERLQQDQRSSNPEASPTGVQGSEELVLTIRLVGEHRDCLRLACGLLNLDPVALVQIIISENVAAYVERGREQQAELRRIIEGEQQGN